MNSGGARRKLRANLPAKASENAQGAPGRDNAPGRGNGGQGGGRPESLPELPDNASDQGKEASAAGRANNPNFLPPGSLPEDEIPSADELIDSLVDSTTGQLVVSPELQDSVSVLFDSNQASFSESITSGETSPLLIEKVTTLETVVNSIAQDPPPAVEEEVADIQEYLLCLLNKLKNTAEPLNAPDCVAPVA
mmetsp:Transcript_6717/g.10321  ORF Transcript_6717/g.10321 Transcript_6717/m.10321 type:complete len:193 (+) Transcript_6717:404-982(+)